MKITIKITLTLYIILTTSFLLHSQVAINADGTSPDASAMLDVTSTTKGILIPRMTTSERTNINSPATGLLVYDTDFNSFWYYANSTWTNLSNTTLSDADKDTKIQVEENSDDDIIRFDLNGTEFMQLDSGRIAIVNTGNSVFLGENAGTFDDYSDNYNVFIGDQAGYFNTSGAYSTLLGGNAGQFNLTGGNNTFLGYNTGLLNTVGSSNIFIGYEAGYSETGSNKLYIENSNSSSPLIYGDFENDSLQINGKLNLNGNYTFPTTDGEASQYLMTDGTGNLSWDSLQFDNLVDTDIDTKIQVEESTDEDIIRFDLGGTEFMRLQSGRLEFDNIGYSTFIGQGAGANDNYSNNINVFLGDSSGYANTSGQYNLFVGYASGYSNVSGERNVFLGDSSGYSNTGDYNTFTGSAAGLNNTSGDRNTFTGNAAGYNNKTGERNTFTGNNTGYSNTSGDNNTFTGNKAGYSNTSGSKNMFIGTEAGYNTTTGDQNIFTGYQAGYSNTTGDNNLYMGNHAGYTNTIGERNVFIGYSAGYYETGSYKLYIDNSDTTLPLIYGDFENDTLRINGTLNIGSEYSFPNTDGDANQALITDGNGALSWTSLALNVLSDTDGDTKIQLEETSNEDIIRFDLAGTEFMRLDSGRIEIVNTGNSIFIGEEAGVNDDYTDNRNIFLGYQAGYENTTGYNNVFTGYQAGYENSTGYNNIFTGYQAGYENSTGYNNIFTGYQAGLDNSTGYDNLYIGLATGTNNTTGYENVFIGTRAGGANDDGNSNVYIGYEAGLSNVSGEKNVYIGYKAGSSATGSNELYIDNSNSSSPLIYGDFENDILELNGSVGIGTTPTNAKFEVLGNGDALASYTYGYLNSSGTTGLWTNAPAYSIYADGKIAGFSFHAHSDERIKNIKGISNSQADLNTLMNIQITDYTLKDTIANGNTMTKKVIAQQVAEVYPQAVSKNTTQVIPDIYQMAEIDENGWVNLTTDLNVGEKVQIIFNNKKELLEVLEVTKNAFRVNKSEIVNPNFSHEARPSKSEIVFIYGRQVDDFHTVDYEAISMLNVSATQQIVKENEALKLKIDELENYLEKALELENQNKQLETQIKKIDELEAKLKQYSINQ